MSYCRWSSDDFQCDVYVYEDVCGGWTTHVAGRRRVLPDAVRAAFPAITDAGNVHQYFDRHAAVMSWIESEPQHWTDLSRLPSAGATFNDPTPTACADRLELLRSEGFHVPQYAIDELRAETITDTAPEVG